MVKIVTFGDINKSLLFILFMSISNVLNQYIYGFTYIQCFYPMNIYKSLYNWIIDSEYDNFPHHRVFDPLFSYLGVIIIAFFFLKCKEEYNNVNEIKRESLNSITGSIHMKLIYNKNKSYLKGIPQIIFFIFILFLWIAEENLLLIYVDIFQDLDFWFFELIFISIIFSRSFLFKIMSHQKLGMAISILVGSMLKIYSISLSLGPDSKTFYSKNKALISFVIFYFFLIILRSYVNTQIKTFYDLKYISHRLLLISYGIAGVVICTLTGIFTSTVSCTENLRDYVCKMGNSTLYYDDFDSYYESGKNFGVRLIVIVLGMVTFFFHKFFYTLIIKYYTPIHVIFSFPVQFFIEKTFLLIFTAIFFNEDLFKEKSQLEKFLLDESGDIASIIGFLIYLEMIELNFCGFNYNLKKNIVERSKSDYIETVLNEMAILQDNDDSDDST
jgi:hypothetical protein